MIWIFGWGHQTTKDFGPTLPVKCPNCNNSTDFHLKRIRKWITLFFLPVIPYKTEHLLTCEICSRGMSLKGNQVQKAQKLNQTTQDFRNGKIREDQYRLKLKDSGLV